MGFFSGSFGQGLVTGLAQGAERTIKTALDKRDEELSSARKYLRERRAQKEERAEAYDLRARKALERLSKETGSASRGLALYEHFGDLDSVEQFIKDVDDTTRKQPGSGFKMADALDWAEANPNAVDNLSMDDAFNAIRYEYTDPSIEFTDTSGLEKIGLGLSAERSQELVGGSPAAGKAVGFKRKPIENLQNVSINRSKLQPAIEYAYTQASTEKELDKVDPIQDYYANEEAISALDPTSPTYEKDKRKLQAKSAALLQRVKNVTNARDTSSGSGSVSAQNLLIKVLDKEVENSYLRNGIDTSKGTFTNADGQTVFAATDQAGYRNAVQAAIDEANTTFVNNQRQADGSFTADGLYVIKARGLGSYMSTAKEETAEETAPQTKPETLTQEELDAKIIEKIPQAADYVDNIFKGTTSSVSIPEPQLQKLFQDIMRIYNVSEDEATVLIDNAMESADAQQAQSKAKPTYKTKAQRKEEEEERQRLLEQQQQNIQSSQFAFSPEG